jgi:protein-tyrosine phosphatase
MTRVLFVCSGNVDRSPTAEALLKGRKGLQVRSAGTWEGARTVVSKELIEWADMIFVMEEHHKQALASIDQKAAGKTIVLNIEDRYLKGDPELTQILKAKLSKYFGEIC